MVTEQILNYQLEIINIIDFKKYYKESLNCFNGFSKKAFLKSVDIPAPYFLEQPEDTQEILLDNKEYLIKNTSKYSDKCLVILKKDNEILNACKMTNEKAEMAYEQLNTISEVENIVWEKSYHKDGYIQGFIPMEEIKKGKYNHCKVIDFPIMLNKPAVIHDAYYKLPTEDSIVEEDVFYYNSSEEVNFMDYQHIALAIKDAVEFSTEAEISVDEADQVFIFREPDEIVSTLLDDKVIPKGVGLGLLNMIAKETEFNTLTHAKLVEFILAFSANVKTIKQLTNLRRCYNWIKSVYPWEKIKTSV